MGHKSLLNRTLNYDFMCLPRGGAIFISNIINNTDILQTFFQQECNNDYIIVISNNQTRCEGCNISRNIMKKIN